MPIETVESSLRTVGAYELLEKIADGGMGSVYRGRSLVTGETVAVKVVPAHLVSTNPIIAKRFEQEYTVARSLDHPNVVRSLDFGREGDTPYLVMEFVEGESLGQRIERQGPLPEHEAIRIIVQVAKGLHKAHKLGLIHRDVKPDNVLITPGGVAKLTDLGLVKEMEADLNLTRTGRGLGTPNFMAPEQFRNAKNADARCDIYSLAATLYMSVTGVLPFQANGPLDTWMKKVKNQIAPPRELVPALSERVDWAIRRAMTPEPEERPASCREFVEDLTGHSTGRTMSAARDQALLWHITYLDSQGRTQTLVGTTQGVRAQLRDGELGDPGSARVSRGPDGPFEPLRRLPEFRDLVVLPLYAPTTSAALQPETSGAGAVEVRAEETTVPEPSKAAAPTSTRPSPAPAVRVGLLDDQLSADPGATDWAAWVGMALMAGAAAAGGFFLIPYLKRNHWL